MTRLRDATVVVTGGASGLGYLIGKGLLEAGARRLLIWDVQETWLDESVERLRLLGHEVEGFHVDVADPGEVGKAVARIRRRRLAVDVLVNNAGVVVGKEFWEHTPEQIERTMAVNSLAPMRLTHELLPSMLERRSGHVVNIASAAGMVGNPKMSVYCASKWALIGWSESLRLELRGRGVKVTTVIPYYISTGMFEGVRSPVLRILTPEAVAKAVVAAVQHDRVLVRMPRILDLVPVLQGLLPTRVFDGVVGRGFGIYDTMSGFRGRSPDG